MSTVPSTTSRATELITFDDGHLTAEASMWVARTMIAPTITALLADGQQATPNASGR